MHASHERHFGGGEDMATGMQNPTISPPLLTQDPAYTNLVINYQSPNKIYSSPNNMDYYLTDTSCTTLISPINSKDLLPTIPIEPFEQCQWT